MAANDIKRKVTIELQLGGSKAAKAASEQMQKYATQAAKSIEQSFAKIASQNAADKFYKHWKKAIDGVRADFKKLTAEMSKAAAAAGKVSVAGGTPVPKAATAAKSKAPSAPPAPAGRVWKSGKFVETTDAEKVAEAERRAIEKLDKQRSQAMARQMAEQEKLAKQQERLAAKALKDQEALRKKEEAEANKRVSELARWQAAHETANRKVADSIKTILDGGIQVAKGLAYVGIVSEESLDKVAKTLVKVEAASSFLKGTLAVWRGLTDAIRAARTATLAQAAANELLAASQAKAAATAGAGVVGGIAGGAAGRAGGSAIGGAAAGFAGGSLARFGSALGRGAVWAGRAAGRAAVNPLTGAIVAGAVAGEGLSSALSSDGKGTFATGAEAYSTWRTVRNQSAAISATENRMEERRKLAAQRDARISSEAAMRMALADRQEADRRMSAESDPNLTALQRGQQSRAAAVAAAEKAEAERQSYQKRVEDRKRQGQIFSFADQAQQFEQESRAAEMRKAAEQEIYRALQQQLEMRKQLVEQSRAAAEQAKATLEAEKERTKDKVASFGRMSSGEQARLADIAKRHSAGEELSRADIDMLERSGFGGNIVRDYYSQKGQQAGGYDVLGQLGERDAEDDAHFEYQQAQGELAKAQVMAQQATTELSEQFKELTKAAQAATAAFQALMQAQNGGTPPPPGTAAPSGEPSVAGVGLGIGNGIDAMGREFNRTVQQVIDNTRRQQTNIAASQIV